MSRQQARCCDDLLNSPSPGVGDSARSSVITGFHSPIGGAGAAIRCKVDENAIAPYETALVYAGR